MQAGGHVIANSGNLYLNEAPRMVAHGPFTIPAPVGDFVGRMDEIEQLERDLRQAVENGATVSICGVRGMGGLGKTQLAYNAAQRMADIFPDGRVLLELRGATQTPMTSEEALGKVISAFEQGSQLPTQRDDLKALYTRVLYSKRVLILADDAHDAAQVDCLLPPPGCALFVTSRQRFLLPSMRVLDLETLSPAEAEKLLLKICPRIGRHAVALAKLGGHLPLALRISATLLTNDRTTSVDAYLRDLTSERLRLSGLQDPNHPNVPAYSVEASISLSYQALDETSQSVLRQLGVFAASFLRASAEAVIQMPGGTVTALNRVLSILHQRSLLDYDETTERFSLHDLVRVFTLQKLREDGDEEVVYLQYAQYYVQVAEYADNLFRGGGANITAGLALFDSERANIDAAWNWAMQQSSSKMTDELLINFADATVYIGDLRYSKRRERVPQLEAALKAARQRNNRAAEGRSLGNLSNDYRDLGEVRRAITYSMQRLAIARELRDRRGEENGLAGLGLGYRNLGEVQQAIAYYEQWLTIAREIGDQRGEGNALGNLGLAYMDLGKIQQAIPYYEQVLTIAQETGDRQVEASTLGNLGLAHAAVGEVQQAIAYYEQVLAIAREIGDRRKEGNTLGNLGLAYEDLGEVRRAIGYFEQRLVIAKEIGDRRGEANGSWNMGDLLTRQGELARAIELMQVRVDFEREIGHVDVEKNAAVVEELRRLLTENEDKAE